MTRKEFLKALRINLIALWVSLFLWIIFDSKIVVVLVGITHISFLAMILYGAYCIIRYNPNLERQDNKEEDDKSN